MSLALPDPHPILVHLPIGLLPLAVVLDLCGWVLGRRPAAGAARWLYLVGVVALWAAVWSGDRAAGALSQPSTAVESAVAAHGDLGHLTAWLFTLVAIGHGFSTRLTPLSGGPRRHPVRLLLLVLALTGVATLALTALRGSGLVFELGLGPGG